MNVATGIAPKTFYKSEAKLIYRKLVWEQLSKRVRPNTWAVIMPARGCEEIEAALSAGVPLDCIFCFDGSAAVIASSEWRKKYPSIEFATCKLSGLAEKLAKHGRKVSAINMDLCGGVGGEAVDEIDAFIQRADFTKRAGIAVNIAKGREGKMLVRMMKGMSNGVWFDCDRMAAVISMVEIPKTWIVDASLLGTSQGTYRDNMTPMSWATFELRSRRHGHNRQPFINAITAAINMKNRELFVSLIDKEWACQKSFAIGSVTGSDAGEINQTFSHAMSRMKSPPKAWL